MSKMSVERKQYLAEYQRTKLHRIPLNVTPDTYRRIKRAADNEHTSVNGFLKTIIGHYLDRYDKKHFPE